jgi:hypothetical protein
MEKRRINLEELTMSKQTTSELLANALIQQHGQHSGGGSSSTRAVPDAGGLSVDSNTLHQYLSLFGQQDVEPLLAAIQKAASSNTGGVNDIYQRDINPPSLPCQAHLQAYAAWGENTNLPQVAAPGFANQQVQQLLLAYQQAPDVDVNSEILGQQILASTRLLAALNPDLVTNVVEFARSLGSQLQQRPEGGAAFSQVQLHSKGQGVNSQVSV